MFAVLKTGGKQYKVASGDVLRVEKLAAQAGDKVQFNDILMVGNTVGEPLVAGAGVQAEVIDQIKGVKTINFVKRRRKHSSARRKRCRQVRRYGRCIRCWHCNDSDTKGEPKGDRCQKESSTRQESRTCESRSRTKG